MSRSPAGFAASLAFGLAVWALLSLSTALAAYEAPDPAYNPPTHYYDAATGTGSTLRGNLHNVISSGYVGRSYGDSRYSMATQYSNGTPKASTDQDPNNSNNILLVYNRATNSGIWDAGATWNREHVWPKFWLNLTSSQVSNSYIGPASDLFELRPADPGVNSARSDDGYGFFPYSGSGTGTGFGANTNGGTTYWFPGTADAGESARTIFYMATRYYDPTNPSRGTDIQNLEIKNGAPALFNFGDLNSLLHWNYIYGVDNFERRRNQYIYGSSGDLTNHALNPTYYQGDRNPFIDHPEYVWAIFGGSANDSQLSIAAPDANGVSNTTADLTRVMRNGTFPTVSIGLNKTGNTPTTFDITTSGNAITVAGSGALTAGTGQPMDYGPQTRSITVGLNASTSTTGLKTGTITIHNTDLTTAGTGKGSADGNDTINVTGAVLDKRIVMPSVASLNFGNVVVGASVSTPFNVTTSGDDSSFTRVNVAGNSTSDSNGIQITGTTALFNSATSTSSRNLGGTLASPGNKSGTLSLAVTTAENGGTGLAGEGAYSSISVGYSATVLNHANGSFDAVQDVDTQNVDFGTIYAGSGAHAAPFSINNLVTTQNFTAGLDLISVNGNGNTSVLATNLAPFANLAANTSAGFQASLDAAHGGSFLATYTLNLSDDATLPGAATQQLTLNLIGTVIYRRGDFNIDSLIDAADLPLMLSALTDEDGFRAANNLSPDDFAAIADVNGDGSVDNADMQAPINALITGVSPSPAAAVPEPSALVLLALGASSYGGEFAGSVNCDPRPDVKSADAD